VIDQKLGNTSLTASHLPPPLFPPSTTRSMAASPASLPFPATVRWLLMNKIHSESVLGILRASSAPTAVQLCF
jgi:hypothetical protein